MGWNHTMSRFNKDKFDVMLLLQAIPILPIKGKILENVPHPLKVMYNQTRNTIMSNYNLIKIKKLSHVIVTPLIIIIMLLLLASSMLNAIPANSQLISENAADTSAVSLSPASSANQSGTIRSLQASEVISFEGQQSNQSFVNQTTISRLSEATEESFETFQIPTTNGNISGPESIASQAFLTGNNINASDSQNVQNRSDILPPPSIGNRTDVLQREEQAEGGDVFGNITTPTPPTPGTMIESRRIDVVPLDLRDILGETSVASNYNDLIFYTGNWYAARSNDAGKTWQYINAYEDFEDFCCDQRVIYDPNHNLFIWYRQGEPDDSANENRVRIGFSNDAITWTMFDIIPSSMDDSFVNTEFDFPELATTDNYLYITTNAFDLEEEEEDMTAVIMRISLDSVVDRGTIELESYWSPETHTFTPVQGAKDKMYWATHLTNDMMRIYEWSDQQPSTSIQTYDREIDPWFILEEGVGKCAPATSIFGEFILEGNWCERADSRITSGWISGTQIGFFWNADAGSRTALGATFPWPYINAATFDVSNNNMSYVGRPYIWHNDFPWLYASAAVNENGEVGVVAYYGQPGTVNIPGVAFGARNQLDKAEAWNMTSLAISSSPPEASEDCELEGGVVDEEECELPYLLTWGYDWGDYITIRSREGSGSDWDAAAYVLEEDGDSDIVMPYYFRISNTLGTVP